MWKRFADLDELQREHTWNATFGRCSTRSTVGAGGTRRDRWCGGASARARSARSTLGIRRSYQPGDTSPLTDELFGTDSLHEVLARCDAVVLERAGNARHGEHVRRGRVRGDEARRGVLQRGAGLARRRGRADRVARAADTSAPPSSTSHAPSRSLPTIRSGTRRTSTSRRTRRRRRTATSRRCSISSPTTSAATRAATTCATWSTGRRVTDAMGRYGFEVIDADGHGGEPLDWRRRIPDRFRPQMVEYVRALKDHYGITGPQRAGRRHAGERRQPRDDDVVRRRLRARRRRRRCAPACTTPRRASTTWTSRASTPRCCSHPGTGEEFALHDRDFSVALCRTLNDARAEFGSYAPDRIKFVAKLPMIDPEAAAEELERCVSEHGFVGMVCPQHVLDKNLDDPSFDVVWATAERLGVAVTVHGGGQAQGQVPFVIERLDSTLTVHAFTHPVGAMLAVTSFTVGGVLHRHPDAAGRVHGSGHRLAAVLARAARRALGARARPGTRDRPRAVALLPRRQLLRHVRARRDDGSVRAAGA